MIKISKYFREFFRRNVEVELDLSNHATVANLKMKQVLIHQNTDHGYSNKYITTQELDLII